MKNKKWLLFAVGSVIILLFFFTILRGVRARRTAAQLPAGMTATVVRGDLDVRVSGTGTVAATAREELRTSAAGTLTVVDLAEGQTVAAGDLVVRLEVQDIATQVQSKKLDISLQEREVSALQKQKTSATIIAPQQGELLWQAQEGDRVQENMPIATIQERTRILARGRFHADEIDLVATGQSVRVDVAGHSTLYAGTVLSVGNIPRSGGDGSVEYDVVVEIPNNGALDQDMQGDVTIETAEQELIAVSPVTLAYPDAVVIRATIAGVIETVKITSGTMVAPSDVLAEINDDQRAEQLATQIANAELRLKQAKLDLSSLQDQQKDRLANSNVTAPIGGTIVLPQPMLAVGDDVNLGTLLATIIDYSRLEVVIPVDELDVAKVKPGQVVTVTADALDDKVMQGEVKNIAHEGIGQGGVSTFDVTIVITDTANLKVGMTVSADILVDSRKEILLIPIETIHESDGKTMVVLAPTGNGSAEEIQVQTGVYDTTHIEVVSGLMEGQELLIASDANNSGIFGGMPRGFGR
ncbi:MAG: HlyD family efflux transporter periplasmic adaptor subunit [Firmicutes bacterium]|nr:HlyD family efflux transporter periplasmic adaptor subunit [Bacillota bacterium]